MNTTTVFKSGAGTLILSSASTPGTPTTQTVASGWAGGIEVMAGTLQLGHSDQIPDRSTLTIDAGATFDMQTFSEAIDGLAGSGSVTVNSPKLFTVGTYNTNTTFSGTLSGAGDFQKVGMGTQTLTGNNTLTGRWTTCQGGALVINGTMPGETSASGPGIVAGTGT